jgi:hypothetical protein
MTANSQAPAIINAIHDAIGVWIMDIPATSEKVLRAIEAQQDGEVVVGYQPQIDHWPHEA